MGCTSDLWHLHVASWVDKERMAGSQAASRRVGYKGFWQLLIYLMKSSFLQLWLLLHHSSLTKHLGVLSLNSEISCVHINQPLSSKKAQFSPSQLFLKAKALPQEGKIPSPFHSQTCYTTVFSLSNAIHNFSCHVHQLLKWFCLDGDRQSIE